MPYKDKDKQREYQRKRVAATRAVFLLNKVCAQCGDGGPFEVDHIDPALKISHNIWSWSPAKRAAELTKCQVLCVPCHRKKTKQDMGYGMEHGTRKGYDYYRCRCRPCKDAKATSQRKYRSSATNFVI